jgi:hypothetical protein
VPYDTNHKPAVGISNYIIDKYMYFTDAGTPAQYSIPINVQQVWIRKVFRIGSCFLDNELAIQQHNINAPVNVPFLMGRHQFSYENALFKHALKVTMGTEVRYTTSWQPMGYDFLLNQFFYQNNTTVSNIPEVSVFINFKVRNRFRAFIMADQLQQLIPGVTNALLYVGLNSPDPIHSGSYVIPVYAMPNAMMRFGFSWVLIN